MARIELETSRLLGLRIVASGGDAGDAASTGAKVSFKGAGPVVLGLKQGPKPQG